MLAKFILLLTAALMATYINPLFSNGRTVEIGRQRINDLEIYIGILPASPRKGTVHFSIGVNKISTSKPVTNAHVTISGTGPSSVIGPFIAKNTLQTPGLYDINLFFEDPGIWEFTVAVKVADDKNTLGSIITTLEIRDHANFDWWVFGYIMAAMPIIISVAWFTRRRIRCYPTTTLY